MVTKGSVPHSEVLSTISSIRFKISLGTGAMRFLLAVVVVGAVIAGKGRIGKIVSTGHLMVAEVRLVWDGLSADHAKS